MDITTALKKGNGKVCKSVDKGSRYAEESEMGVLQWYRADNNMYVCIALLCDILGGDWVPFNPVTQIVPEKAGELWEKDGVHYLTVHYDENLTFVSKFSAESLFNKAIHGVNGWEREYPKVEEDVERIEIDGVEYMESNFVGYNQMKFKYGKKPIVPEGKTMKMILETPKESP